MTAPRQTVRGLTCQYTCECGHSAQCNRHTIRCGKCGAGVKLEQLAPAIHLWRWLSRLKGHRAGAIEP